MRWCRPPLARPPPPPPRPGPRLPPAPTLALARWAGGPGGVADGAGVPQTKDGLPPLGLAQRFAEAPGGAVDFRGELLQLNRALTSAFLDLLDALVAEETETAWEEKVDELRAVMHNMMHLANRLRPLQARAALRAQLEQEAAARRAALDDVQRGSELAGARIAATEACLRAAPGGGGEAGTARGGEGAAGGGAAGGRPPEGGAAGMEVG